MPDILGYLNSKVGLSTIDGDAYGAQCVALVVDYSRWLGRPIPLQNAIDLVKFRSPDYKWIPYGSGFVVQLGDILVFGGSQLPFGHTSIGKEGTAAEAVSLDQNWINFNAEHGSSATWVTHTYTGEYPLLGVLRPNISNNQGDDMITQDMLNSLIPAYFGRLPVPGDLEYVGQDILKVLEQFDVLPEHIAYKNGKAQQAHVLQSGLYEVK